MKPEDVTNYHELSEDVKDQYKPINAEGDFISESAIENTEVAHRIAILEHEAFGELEEGITNGGITVDEIVAKLADKHTVFDEQRKLKEMLFQHADLRRLKGAPIDDQLVDVLKKTYASLEYSKILTEKLTKGIEDGDVAVIGEMLKDEKFHASWAIFKKLSTDKERVAAFAVCKERIKSACLLINEVQDIEVALAMYIEALPLADEKSHSDKGNIESTGKNLAEKFFASGATEKLIELLKSGDFKLSYCKDFMNLLGDRQEVIIDMIKYSSNVKDICYALKFVTKPELLTRLGEEEENLMKLDSEKSDEVTAHAEKIANALMNKPSIMILSELKGDKKGDYGDKLEAKNKFVVGIQGDKYVIAMSNMDTHEYHQNIFDSIRGGAVRSGGYLGIQEEGGKTIVRMVRSSSDFGLYSKELLEIYRDDIEKSLHEALGVDEFELVIKTSASYE